MINVRRAQTVFYEAARQAKHAKHAKHEINSMWQLKRFAKIREDWHNLRKVASTSVDKSTLNAPEQCKGVMPKDWISH